MRLNQRIRFIEYAILYALPSNVDGLPQYLPAIDEETTLEPSGTSRAAYYGPYRFTCQAPPWYKSARRCTTVEPTPGQTVGVGLLGSSEGRWVYVKAVTIFTKNEMGAGRIHKDHDAHDWLYTGQQGEIAGLYAKTSCLSNCWKWTYMSAYKDKHD